MNSRIKWTGELREAIVRSLGRLPADQRANIESILLEELNAAIRSTTDQHNDLREQQGRSSAKESVPLPSDPSTAIDILLAKVSGLEGKQPALVEVISPSLAASSGLSVDELLAGEFLFHFGGFIDVKFRQSDFRLGWGNVRSWMKECLPGYIDRKHMDLALRAVDAAYEALDWKVPYEGGASWGTLSWSEKAELVRLAGHIAHIVERDVRHDV